MCDWKSGDFKSLSRTLHPSSTHQWSGLSEMNCWSRCLHSAGLLYLFKNNNNKYLQMHGTQNQAATSQFHWGSEASQTCIQFREIGGAEKAEATFPKTKQMQDIKCVCVCVWFRCIHGLKVIVFRHEVQPNLWKETIQLCDGLSCVDTHGETSGIRWHSPPDSLS